mgnify:FL=1|jgi:hypothetical protein
MRAAKARALSILLIALALPLHAVGAKSPAPKDEAVVREIVAKIYEPYSQPLPEAPEDGSYARDNAAGSAASGYEPPYTQSLAAQIARWDSLMQESEELYGLNGFDWYCQCQDNDNATAKLLSQHYKLRSKGGIEATIVFSPGRGPEGDQGAPLRFRFRNEDGAWKIDDLIFEDGSTLRKSLLTDIADASKVRR